MSREVKFRRFIKHLMFAIAVIATATAVASFAIGDISSAWKVAVLGATALITLKIEV